MMSPELGMFWATVGLVLITVFASTLNYFLLRTQTDPHVIVYSANDPDRPSIINIVIKNVGRGPAHNVRFQLSKAIPWRAFGVAADKAPQAEEMKKGPLITGVPLLAPGEERVMTWGQFGGLEKNFGGQSARITAHYESKGVLPFNPTDHSTESVLEVDSFAGTVAHRPWFVRVAADLGKMRTQIDRLASGFKPVHVRIVEDAEEPPGEEG